MPPDIQVIDLKHMGYRQAFAIQEMIYRKCDENLCPDTIIFQENDPVITLGRGSDLSHLLTDKETLRQLGIEVVSVDRGGDITYHGPGQLVVSILIHIRKYSVTVHQYLRNLEEIVIRILAQFGISAGRIEGKSGVWVDNKKVAATGISVTHGITRHGIAINVHPDLTHFDHIIPCGIRDKEVTSLKALGIEHADTDEIKRLFIREFNDIFNTVITQPIEIKGDITYEN